MIKIDKTVKNKKIPKYFMNKWKDENGAEYEWYTYEQQQKGIEKWNEILSKTSLTEEEYFVMLERKLLEKSDQLLKRTNFV